MPKTARRFMDLPGIDPTFHEVRRYLTPIKYKGEEILASHASCKQTGCNFSKAWTNNAARDRGAWEHRQEHVRAERLAYFSKIAKRNSLLVAEYFRETADRNSHTFEDWKDIVKNYIRTIAGVDDEEVELRERTLIAYYHIGTMAKAMAEKILDEEYDIA